MVVAVIVISVLFLLLSSCIYYYFKRIRPIYGAISDSVAANKFVASLKKDISATDKLIEELEKENEEIRNRKPFNGDADDVVDKWSGLE